MRPGLYKRPAAAHRRPQVSRPRRADPPQFSSGASEVARVFEDVVRAVAVRQVILRLNGITRWSQKGRPWRRGQNDLEATPMLRFHLPRWLLGLRTQYRGHSRFNVVCSPRNQAQLEPTSVRIAHAWSRPEPLRLCNAVGHISSAPTIAGTRCHGCQREQGGPTVFVPFPWGEVWPRTDPVLAGDFMGTE